MTAPPRYSLKASAPLRLDSGGTTDLAPLGLGLWPSGLSTINVAIDARARARLVELGGDECLVEYAGTIEQGRPDAAPYDTPLGAFMLVLATYGLGGVRLELSCDVDVGLGLGSSASLLVAAVAAVAQFRAPKAPPATPAEIAWAAFRIESSLAVCGIQDHLAAAFGGANRWCWRQADLQTPVQQDSP